MFKGDLRVKYDNVRKRWNLLFPITYVDKRGIEIEVPAGYSTDLDSVPRVPFAYSWLKGRATKSAVIHDWLYYNKHNRSEADSIFLQAMKDEGVGRIRRYAIYSAVRAFGWTAYKKKPE